MEPKDILYTPLNVEVPQFDIPKLREWMAKNSKQSLNDRADGSLRTPRSLYPWNISYGMIERKWAGNFDKEFPDMVQFLYDGFNIKPEDMYALVFLPSKPDFVGVGFWHADPDETGLRIYLDNDDGDKDFLLMKRTKRKLLSRRELGNIPDNGISPRFCDEIITPKLYKPSQAFYLNNVCAIHSAQIHRKNATRIAILPLLNEYHRPWKHPKVLNDLIISSAETFKDFAIYWDPQHNKSM